MTDPSFHSLSSSAAATEGETRARLRRLDTGEWCAVRHETVRALLSDERLTVPEVSQGCEEAVPGTMTWLRSSVSRFVNGELHASRRAAVAAVVDGLSPERLRSQAETRAASLIEVVPTGESIDVMSRLSRRVPVEALAAEMGLGDPSAIAEQVIVAAAGYFPGSSNDATARADTAVGRLMLLCEASSTETTITNLAIMLQACDATAGLVGCSLLRLRNVGTAAEKWPTLGVVRETARLEPPLRRMRRQASEALREWEVPAGATIVCDIEAANSDQAAFSAPQLFDPNRSGLPSILTFGWGLRPCPGSQHALSLAAGVVDAVRTRCSFVEDGKTGWEDSPLRIPSALHVKRRD